MSSIVLGNQSSFDKSTLKLVNKNRAGQENFQNSFQSGVLLARDCQCHDHKVSVKLNGPIL